MEHWKVLFSIKKMQFKSFPTILDLFFPDIGVDKLFILFFG